LVSKGTFYGVAAVLVALLILSSAVAVYYYSQYQTVSSQSETIASEVGMALNSYASLVSRYNSSLSDYNTTLSLLALAVGSLNTTTPAYRTASLDLSSLWQSYQALARAGGAKVIAYSVHLLVDYGNGTRRWYNDSGAQPGWNGYVVSLVLLNGNLNATWYPEFGEHYITGINKVPQTSSKSWSLWELSGRQWTYFPVGADQLQPQNGTVIAWALCGYDSSFRPTCIP